MWVAAPLLSNTGFVRSSSYVVCVDPTQSFFVYGLGIRATGQHFLSPSANFATLLPPQKARQIQTPTTRAQLKPSGCAPGSQSALRVQSGSKSGSEGAKCRSSNPELPHIPRQLLLPKNSGLPHIADGKSLPAHRVISTKYLRQKHVAPLVCFELGAAEVF